MKTKTTPRAHKMWANYYSDHDVVMHISRKSAESCAQSGAILAGVPVAVIPLHDVEVLISKATDAFLLEDCRPTSCILSDRMVAALTAIGVLPKSKGGRK